MNRIPSRAVIAVTLSIALFALVITMNFDRIEGSPQDAPRDPIAADKCAACHAEKTPVIAQQWRDSKHGKGAVGCLECHTADAKEPDAFLHHGKWIKVVVTPNNCATCHADQAEQFAKSHHAKGAQFVGSLDNILGEIVEGRVAAANGCLQCHGSTVALVKDEKGVVQKHPGGAPKYDPFTWPNSGIGRINIDGSKGSCTACHSRHSFAKAIARQPESCGKCHMGPDHPQIEAYLESKHGIAFRTQIEKMNLSADSWIAGKDYSAAPTCATCHMSATPKQKATHDVGERIAWTLRPAVSKKLENADDRRTKMKDVCAACHSVDFSDAFFTNYDATVETYNDKFGKPATEIMNKLREKGKLTPTPFDEELEWTYYFLWHHEGRRARMGASKMAPDYVQWHGFFEVAHRFYFEFIPKAEELARDDADVKKAIETVMNSPEHKWKKGMSKEDIQKIQEFYKQRYGPK